jgi:hypothetical protein
MEIVEGEDESVRFLPSLFLSFLLNHRIEMRVPPPRNPKLENPLLARQSMAR